MHIDQRIEARDLASHLDRFFAASATKIRRVAKSWNPAHGAPVFTVRGRYTARGWTEWTQGFQFGCQLLQFDATGDGYFLELGRDNTRRYMAAHVSHAGVHDHGFNNVSTYGNLRRLAMAGKFDASPGDVDFWELALKASGAVQAARWTDTHAGGGYIHSFNGPHSLFSDTIRSCRSLVLADALGQCLMGENDRRICLLGRALEHLQTTARYNVYYGEGRDAYDVRGRTAHESIFNITDGHYRCPSTQQGYSPFSTWTRGLAWVMLGAAEQLEFLRTVEGNRLKPYGGRKAIESMLVKMATATSDFFIANSAADGIPYWDTGAPGLAQMGDYRERPSEPDNPFEPVDSSAAAIAAQGLLRLGRYLGMRKAPGRPYWQAGLRVAKTLLEEPYASAGEKHQGLLLHSVYHRPNGWDYIPAGRKVPQGESSMWGDYHMMELAVYLRREIDQAAYYTFFGDQKRG